MKVRYIGKSDPVCMIHGKEYECIGEEYDSYRIIYASERNDNMNDNFKCIYKILKTLEKALDYESISLEEIGYEHLKIREIRWIHYLEMMSDVGLINGIEFKTYVDGSTEAMNKGV